MRMKIGSLVIASAMLVSIAYADFFDGIKKIGGGITEAAGSAFDSTVNVATGAVQRISTNLGETNTEPAPQNMPTAVQQTADPVQMPLEKADMRNVEKPIVTQQPSQHEATQEGRKKVDMSFYAKERAGLEQRLLNFCSRKDFLSIESVSERNRIKNQITLLKSELYPLPATDYNDDELRKLNSLLSREKEVLLQVKEVFERETADRERVKADREKAERERAEREAHERAEREKAEHDRVAAVEKRKAVAEKARRDAVTKVHEILVVAHAKAAGSPEGYEFKPISVFRNVKLGMTVEEVCAALDIKGVHEFLHDASEYKEWIGGKAKKVTLESHTLYLQFAQIVDGVYPQHALITAQMEFNDKDNAPDLKAVCERYAQIPGVKAMKEKEKHGEKFKDDATQFWKVVYRSVSDNLKFQKKILQNKWALATNGTDENSCKALIAKLEMDEKSLKADLIEDVFREVDVFDVDGMQIRVKPNMKTKRTSFVAFEDCVMSKILVTAKDGIKAKKAKAEAEAKAAAEKKSKSDSLNF